MRNFMFLLLALWVFAAVLGLMIGLGLAVKVIHQTYGVWWTLYFGASSITVCLGIAGLIDSLQRKAPPPPDGRYRPPFHD
jgi:hypothetical protein